MPWTVYAASATGSSHLESGTPCQDAHAHRQVGNVLVAAVCDGAGSQPRSDAGARQVAEGVVAALAVDVDVMSLDSAADESAIRARIESAISAIRDGLAMRAGVVGADLAHFACTLVGLIADGNGGWFFHIGDGAGIAADGAGSERVAGSDPDNGEYANETWFVTSDEWRAHLRLTRIDRGVAVVALMSDGAMPFALARGGQQFYAPFIEPVLKFLDGVDEVTGSHALLGTLDDPRTHRITPDDKTLLLARWR